MSLRFIPPPAVGRYALFVEDGDYNFFKVYNDLGHAKNGARVRTRYWSDKTRAAAKILEMVDGEWYVLYDIPKDSTDFPWVKDVESRWSTRTRRKAVPLTRDEYAEFRVKVAWEQAGLVAA